MCFSEKILKTIERGKNKTQIVKLKLKAKNHPTKDGKLGKEEQKQERRQQKTKSKIVSQNPTISITTVKANSLNTLKDKDCQSMQNYNIQ